MWLGATSVHLAVNAKWIGSSKFLNDDTILLTAMLVVALYGSLIFPLAILKTVLPRLRAVFAGYVIICLISPFLAFILLAFTLFNEVKIIGEVLICFSPLTLLTALCLSETISASSRAVCLLFSLIAVAIYCAALAYRSMQSFRDIRRGEQTALKVIKEEGMPLEPLPPIAQRLSASMPVPMPSPAPMTAPVITRPPPLAATPVPPMPSLHKAPPGPPPAPGAPNSSAVPPRPPPAPVQAPAITAATPVAMPSSTVQPELITPAHSAGPVQPMPENPPPVSPDRPRTPPGPPPAPPV
jgi:hypothetical protein